MSLNIKPHLSFRASSFSSVSFGSPAVLEAESPPSEQIIRGSNLHPRRMGSCDSTKKLSFVPRAKTADSNKMKYSKETDRFFNNPLFGRLLTAVPLLKNHLNEKSTEISISVIEEGIIESLIRLNKIFKKAPPLTGLELIEDFCDESDLSGTFCFYNSFHALATFNNIDEIFRSNSTIIYRLINRIDQQWYCVKTGINYNEMNKLRKLSESNFDVLREIKILSTLNHENIVRYHKSWIEQQCIFLQMEYLVGESLYYFMYSTNSIKEETCDSKFKKKEMFPLTNKASENTAIKIIKQIGNALNYLHNEKSIVHNDIQPSNILITCLFDRLDNGKQNLSSIRSKIYQEILSDDSIDVTFKLIDFTKSFYLHENIINHNSLYFLPFNDSDTTPNFLYRDIHGLAMSTIHSLSGSDNFFPEKICNEGIGKDVCQNEDFKDLLMKMIDSESLMDSRYLCSEIRKWL